MLRVTSGIQDRLDREAVEARRVRDLGRRVAYVEMTAANSRKVLDKGSGLRLTGNFTVVLKL
jgi:hypothetical protein